MRRQRATYGPRSRVPVAASSRPAGLSEPPALKKSLVPTAGGAPIEKNGRFRWAAEGFWGLQTGYGVGKTPLEVNGRLIMGAHTVPGNLPRARF
jgi:hypothetical protein